MALARVSLECFLFIIIIIFCGFCFFRFIYPFIPLLSIFWHIEMLRKKLILKCLVFTLKSTSPAKPLCNQFFCPSGYRPKFWYMRLSLCLQNCLLFLTLQPANFLTGILFLELCSYFDSNFCVSISNPHNL